MVLVEISTRLEVNKHPIESKQNTHIEINDRMLVFIDTYWHQYVYCHPF